jgi:hypothetical protein
MKRRRIREKSGRKQDFNGNVVSEHARQEGVLTSDCYKPHSNCPGEVRGKEEEKDNRANTNNALAGNQGQLTFYTEEYSLPKHFQL